MSLPSTYQMTATGMVVKLHEVSEDVRRSLMELWERGNDGIERGGKTLQLTHEAVWGLSDEVLTALGVHRTETPVRVVEAGIPGRPRYSWTLQWPAGAEVDGCWLHGLDGATVLPPEVLELKVLQARVAGARKVVVFRAILRLQELASTCALIRLPDRIIDSRIREVGALRIEVENPSVGPHFTPILTEAGEDGSVIEVPLGIVIDDIAGRSADDSVIAVGRRDFLVMPKGVFQNLVLTSAAAEQPTEVRNRFVENPMAFLPDPDSFDEAHYSERVIGVCEAPRSPAGDRIEGRSWVEPTDGLLIEGPSGLVWVPGDALGPLLSQLQDAMVRGQTSVEWEGQSIPARSDILQAIRRAAALPNDHSMKEKAEDGSSRPRVLRIQENEVVLDWAPVLRGGRRAPAPHMPPLAPDVTLKPHQMHALARLKDLWVRGETGALLCDDMGLGKTIQALVFAAWVHQQLQAGGGARSGEAVSLPIMVVAPPSLLESWLTELGRRLPPQMFPHILWGAGGLPSKRHKRKVLLLKRFRLDRNDGTSVVVEHARLDMDALRVFAPDILFIGYDTLRSLQFAVGELRVGIVIADEAQQVKNPGSLRSHALRAMNYDFALALTGTPIENSWTDLWTLCDFAVPGLLGPLADFRRTFPNSGVVRETGERLASAVGDVLIRRTRGKALRGLPRCDVRSVKRVMPAAQALAYRAEVTRYSESKRAILGLLQGLARVSLHQRLRAELATSADAEAWLRESARTSILYENLLRWREEAEPVLVFVRALAAQATLSRALKLVFGLSNVEVLNGQIAFAERQQVVRRMEYGAGFRVLLVSPDVGGAGWNLQFAARSFLLERPFNPAVEAQMIARTWRLGQTRPVEVVAPIATLEGIETFDEVLDQLLRDKRELAESVLAPAVVQNEEIVRRFSRLSRTVAK